MFRKVFKKYIIGVKPAMPVLMKLIKSIKLIISFTHSLVEIEKPLPVQTLKYDQIN